jgi:hypothetical protein
MKRNNLKKLVLARETLRELADDQLENAAGGGQSSMGPVGVTILCAPKWVQKLEHVRSNLFCTRKD